MYKQCFRLIFIHFIFYPILFVGTIKTSWKIKMYPDNKKKLRIKSVKFFVL